MTLNFCTLFDSNFITQGMVMYESLCNSSKDFYLYIVAFDDVALDILKKLNLPKITVISLEEFEDEKLLKVKKERTAKEYCWTCSSSVILYCIERYSLDHCTYLDADLYFYSDPRTLIDEIRDDSVIIARHNYAPEYDQSTTSGIYCVQFMTFLNDFKGISVLKWWRNACLAWCYDKFENGKFGDQKYLDDWTERFDCVHVLQNFGGGLAPWNRTKYSIDRKMNVTYGNETYPLCFYHFHDLRFQNGRINRSYFLCYKMPITYLLSLYIPYLSKLLSTNKKLHKISAKIPKYSCWSMFRLIKDGCCVDRKV